MRFLPAFAVAVPLCLSIAACARTPDEAARKFVLALADDTWSVALGQVDDSMRETVPVFKIETSLRQQHEHIRRCGGLERIDLNQRGGPGSADRPVDVTLHFRGMCVPQAMSFQVVDAGGEWRILFDPRWPMLY